MVKKYFLFGLFIWLGIVLQASEQDDLFMKANQSYQEKNYSSALKIYEELLDKGNKSAALHYNVGNCYYKTKQIGKAILHYERALFLDRNDEDTRYNLELAYKDVEDDFGTIADFFLFDWWNKCSKLLSSTLWSILGILLLWLGVAGLVLWVMGKERGQRKKGFLAGILLILFSFLPLGLAYTKASLEQHSGYAIILAKETPINSAPESGSTVLYQLHEGTKVKLLDKIGAWYKVRLSNGEQGWVIDSDLEEI